MGRKTKQGKACDITINVRNRVWERDQMQCVVCGSWVNVMPNAHYIPRSKGGLGIEQNIVTLCTRLTENDCHYRFDNGTAEERTEIGRKIKAHLQKHYPDWDESNLIYRKGMNT